MGPTEKRVCLVQMHGPRETPNGTSHLGGAGFPVTPRLPRQGLAPTPAAGRACGMGGRAQPQARTVTDAATRGDPGPPLGPSLQSELLAAAVSRALVPCGTPVGRRRAVRGRGRSGQPRAGRWPGRLLCSRPPSSGLRPPPSRLCRRVRIQERICAEDISHCPPTACWLSHREGITPATQDISVWASACPHRGARQSPVRSQGGVLLPGGELGPHSRVTR